MPTIDDILQNLGVGDTAEKTASAKTPSEAAIEKQAQELGLTDGKTQTKTASSTLNGGKMNSLDELYNNMFSSVVKTAAEEGSEEGAKKDEEEKKEESEGEKQASAFELAGEKAGEVFSALVQDAVLDHAIKIAMDGLPDSKASQEVQSGAVVIPGAANKNPQLPVGRREDAEKPMDLTPEYYDLKGMSGAVTKARLESQLASGNIDALSHKTVNVGSGIEVPAAQKTAGIKNLSRQQLLVLNAEFPEDMMKQARAIVEDELEKKAELEGIAADCLAYGEELAMQKIAEMEAKSEESEDSDDEEEEEEKTASAMGKFVFQGYMNTLMEKGAEFHGNKDIYIEELIKEAGYDKVIKFMNKAKGQAVKGGKKALSTSKKVVKKNPGKAMAGAGAAGLGLGFAAGKKD